MTHPTITKSMNVIGDIDQIHDALVKKLPALNFTLSSSERPTKIELTRGNGSVLAKSIKDVKTVLTITLEKISDNVNVTLEYVFEIPSLYVNKSDKSIEEEFEQLKREIVEIFPYGKAHSIEPTSKTQQTYSLQRVILNETMSVTPNEFSSAQNEELQNRLKKLSDMIKGKDEFMMNIIDDMKFNLSELDVLVENLTHSGVNLNKAYLDQFDALKYKFQTLTRIMNNLFDIQKIEMNELILTKSSTRLSLAIDNVVKSLKNNAERHNVEITTEIVEDITCTCDRKRIEQVLTTLILNAIDFSKESNGKIKITLQRDDNNAKISIKDNGIGIIKDSLEKIFDRIYQLNLDIIREHGEAGLGLPVARVIIDEHSGKIWAESQGPDSGSEIHILLPLENTQSEILRRVQ